MRFLVIEDDSIAADRIRCNLETLGYYVDVAETGLRGVHLAYREYDCILLDLGLPDIDGLEVAKRIRQTERVHNIILSISSLGNVIREPCLKAGFNDVFSKPLDILSLTKIIERVHNEKRYRTSQTVTSCKILGGVPSKGFHANNARPLP